MQCGGRHHLSVRQHRQQTSATLRPAAGHLQPIHIRLAVANYDLLSSMHIGRLRTSLSVVTFTGLCSPGSGQMLSGTLHAVGGHRQEHWAGMPAWGHRCAWWLPLDSLLLPPMRWCLVLGLRHASLLAPRCNGTTTTACTCACMVQCSACCSIVYHRSVGGWHVQLHWHMRRPLGHAAGGTFDWKSAAKMGACSQKPQVFMQ